jgi:uncharacterized protein
MLQLSYQYYDNYPIIWSFPMPNQLINETSPYLLQHADNPVNWLPWNDVALQIAKDQNKPIFLSIGYAACHWCHVMAHESFEDPKIAEIINSHFVPIKVDREERPDLDSIYMAAVVAMTRRGGWPMSVFLTPKGQPFYGGTYFPPTARHGLPSFREVLISVAETWAGNKSQIENSAETLTAHIQQNQSWETSKGPLIEHAKLQKAAKTLISSVDSQNGGWGSAPKFPAPMALDFLLLQHMHANVNGNALPVVIHTLKQIEKGGIYDVVGGGFHRYATDHAWLIPHFEKMLYDNAQLATTYLHAHLITGEQSFRRTCGETLDFLIREMRHPKGGFFSSLDADSEGQEGIFYIWTKAEIHAALSEYPRLEELVLSAYPITESGNFKGQNILRRNMRHEELAEQRQTPLANLYSDLDAAHSHLREYRSRRLHPGTDDKVLTSWNALALRAFSEAARYLHRQDYLEIAEENADFLLDALYTQNRLKRSWREGQANQDAFLEDYASLIVALISLYQTSPKLKWYQAALTLTHEMIDAYQAPDGSFYATRHDQEDIIFRPRELQDNVTPSGNALAAQALAYMAIYTGREDWQQISDNLLASAQEYGLQYPTSFAYWLQTLDFATRPNNQVAILLPEGSNPPAWFKKILWTEYHPDVLLAESKYPPDQPSPILLQFRPLEKESPTIYLCRGTTCLPAITSKENFQKSLREL